MVNPNEDTEFNDALRAHGILPPKPPSRSPSPDIPHLTSQQALQTIASQANPDQLTTLLEGDNLDSDDERMFEDYKRKRLAEITRVEKKGRFGSLIPLGREDFVREVTEASRVGEDGEVQEDDDDEEEVEDGIGSGAAGNGKGRGLRGTGVVVFLYKDSIPLSQQLRPLLDQLAQTHTSTKFMAIRADLCIPNYPDKNVPTLLVYRNGELLRSAVGAGGIGVNANKPSVEELETSLHRFGAISSRILMDQKQQRRARDEEEDADDDLGEGIGTVNTKSGGIRNGTGRGRGEDEVDEDSDFDM